MILCGRKIPHNIATDGWKRCLEMRRLLFVLILSSLGNFFEKGSRHAEKMLAIDLAAVRL